MTTAILCPGPSLSQTFKGGSYDSLIAVNRAAHLTACDWWVSLDPPSFETPPPHVPPNWLTMRSTRVQIKPSEGVAVHDVEDWFDRLPADIGGCAWCTFSMTAAMMAAHSIGATRIDLYGYDATDAPDYDGTRHPISNRTSGRWEHEALCYAAMVAWLAKHGCAVNRIRP